MVLIVRAQSSETQRIPFLRISNDELSRLRDFSLRQAQDRHPCQGFELTHYRMALSPLSFRVSRVTATEKSP